MANNQEKSNYTVPHSGTHDKSGQPVQTFADRYYEYEVSHSGTTHMKYEDPQNSGNNFSQRAGQMGEFEHWQRNGSSSNSIYTEMLPNARREWDKNKKAHTKDNNEHYTGGVGNKNTKNEKATTTTKNEMTGVTNTNIALHGNDGRVRASSTFMNASEKGIHIQTTSGENRIYHEGNQVTTTQGAHYAIHQSDCGIHCQKEGNYDVRTQKGKLQIQTGKGELRVKSGSTMVINAASKIEIKVGGSTITIENSQITVKSQKITLDGESHIGSPGGQLCGTCGGGCATKVYVT